MSFNKLGLLFFAVFVGSSEAQKLFEGVPLSVGVLGVTLLVGAIATGVFVLILRLVGK